MIVGSAIGFVGYGYALLRGVPRLTAFTQLRASLGRAILLGLEVLVVADIVRTIVVEPTLEVEGVAPWRKAEGDRGTGG